MNRRRISAVVLLSIMGTAAFVLNAAAESDMILVDGMTKYSRYGHVPQNIRSECRPELKLAPEIAQNSLDVMVVETSKLVSGNILNLRIDFAGLIGRHQYAVQVSGSLDRDGKRVGSFTALRSPVDPTATWGGAAGRACSRYDRSVAFLARDIAEFLEAPSMNAKLGLLE